MKRVFMTIAYDGTDYVGWQMQPNGTAVEEVINRELSKLLGEEIVVIGASRTDSGVHALGNVAVFDTNTSIPADKISFALNRVLPRDIVISESHEVDADFHPRHADCIKTYEYNILNSVHPNPVLWRYSHFVYIPLDIEAMRKGAEYLLGRHDFSSFCSAHAQTKTTIRTIQELSIEEKAGDVRGMHLSDGQRLISIRIAGDGFLYNMVRIIAGTLIRVGHHMYPPEHVKEILEACDRTVSGPKAPAQGLTLLGIKYT